MSGDNESSITRPLKYMTSLVREMHDDIRSDAYHGLQDIIVSKEPFHSLKKPSMYDHIAAGVIEVVGDWKTPMTGSIGNGLWELEPELRNELITQIADVIQIGFEAAMHPTGIVTHVEDGMLKSVSSNNPLLIGRTVTQLSIDTANQIAVIDTNNEVQKLTSKHELYAHMKAFLT